MTPTPTHHPAEQSVRPRLAPAPHEMNTCLRSRKLPIKVHYAIHSQTAAEVITARRTAQSETKQETQVTV